MALTLRNYLEVNHIPYDYMLNKKNEAIFATPNITIIAAPFEKIRRTQYIKNYVDIINTIPTKPIYLYTYLTRNTSDSKYNTFIKKMNETMLTYMNYMQEIVYISDVNEIINIPRIMDFNYIINDRQVILSLVNNMNFVHHTIVVSWDVYNKAICLLNDDELKRLSNYIFHIVDNVEHNDNSVYLIRRRNFESPRFNMVIEDIPLDGGHRNIQRVIDGVTIYCEKCNHITYVQHLMH